MFGSWYYLGFRKKCINFMPMFGDFARAFPPSNQIDFDFPTSFYGASSQTLSEEPPSINNIQVLSSMYSSKYIKTLEESGDM